MSSHRAHSPHLARGILLIMLAVLLVIVAAGLLAINWRRMRRRVDVVQPAPVLPLPQETQ